MDLNEAEKSFDYYANLLKMQCALLSRASEMEVTAASTEMALRASEVRNKLLADLEESRKNSLILSILVCEEMAKEAQQLICVPMELQGDRRFKPSDAGISAGGFAYRRAEEKTGSKDRAGTAECTFKGHSRVFVPRAWPPQGKSGGDPDS